MVADSEVELIQDVCDGLGGAERILAVGPNAATAGATWTWHDVTTLPERDEIAPRLDGDEALLMYTSGSTGIPKVFGKLIGLQGPLSTPRLTSST